MRALAILLITSLIIAPLAGCASAASRQIDTAPRPENDWRRVATIKRGNAITVVPKGGPSLIRTFVTADESELVALDLASPALPGRVKSSLRSLALNRPGDLVAASHGQPLTEHRVRLGPDGVFLDGRKVVDLNQVLQSIARNDVAEVARIHRATERGLGWGALIGLGLGLAVTLGSCGTNWSGESSSCTNLTPLILVVAPLWGTLLGGLVGAATEVSTVVYRAPP